MCGKISICRLWWETAVCEASPNRPRGIEEIKEAQRGAEKEREKCGGRCKEHGPQQLSLLIRTNLFLLTMSVIIACAVRYTHV